MDKIKIFSLGGLNENGKNMYVVEVNDDIFVLDAGLKYADDRLLGVDYILPNYDYIKENKERVKGIFITHAHDGQMGAVLDIIRDIENIKVYGTTFTVDILKAELAEENISSENVIEIKAHKKIDFGKTSIFPFSLTHSVPDAVGYAINTTSGAIVYTGNFVFDPTMTGAYQTDIGKLAYIGKQGVLCLMSESLYSEKKGFTSPNHRIASHIKEIIHKNESRILINVFNDQLRRIQEIFTEVNKTDRNVVVLGKRLETTITKAIEKKYIDFNINKLKDIRSIREENIIVLISDEREKLFTNINRIVKGYDKFVKLTEEDTVVFASPIYEGMEKSSTKLFNKIAKLGCNLEIISSSKYLGHHASSEDLMMMLELMKPKYYFPVIGEYKHQVENAKLAYKLGMNEENVILKLNGEVATFEDDKLIYTNDKIKVDDILIDGKTIGDVGDLVIKDRELLSENGVVLVSATLDRQTKKLLAGPEILTRGFIYVKENSEIIKEAEKIAVDVITENTRLNYVDFAKVKSGVRDKLGKYLYKETECKPMILIVLQEV